MKHLLERFQKVLEISNIAALEITEGLSVVECCPFRSLGCGLLQPSVLATSPLLTFYLLIFYYEKSNHIDELLRFSARTIKEDKQDNAASIRPLQT